MQDGAAAAVVSARREFLAPRMHVPRPTILTGHTAAVYALASWRGGVLSGGGDGRLAHWAAPYDADGRLVAQLDDRLFCIAPLTGDQDGQIVLGTLTGDLYWVDAAARTPPRRWQLHRDGLFGLCTAGDYLFAVGGGGQLSRWRLADGTFDEAVAVDTVRLRSVGFLPEAGLLLVGTAAGDLHLVDPASLRTVDVVERAHGNTVFDIAVGRGGSTPPDATGPSGPGRGGGAPYGKTPTPPPTPRPSTRWRYATTDCWPRPGAIARRASGRPTAPRNALTRTGATLPRVAGAGAADRSFWRKPSRARATADTPTP